MRGQLSFEVLLLFAAYVALLAVFLAAENSVAEGFEHSRGEWLGEVERANDCFVVDFFSLQSRAEFDLRGSGGEGFSAVECVSASRAGAGGVLSVERGEREVV